MKSSNVSTLFDTDDKRQKTVASKFRRRLKKLLEDVSRTETRYVRCVKPNSEASSSLFDASSVCAQLRCAGVVAAVEMTRSGYPNRSSHAAFCARYGRLTSESDVESVARSLLGERRHAVGKTRVYLGPGVFEFLERLLSTAHARSATSINTCARRYLQLRRFSSSDKRLSVTVQRRRRGFVTRKAFVSLVAASTQRCKR